MKRVHALAITLAGLVTACPLVAADEADAMIEAIIHLKTLFAENFERNDEGTAIADGGVVQMEGNSKQLVGTDSVFNWKSESISLSEPILTNLSIHYTAFASPDGFTKEEHVSIYAVLLAGYRPL